MGNLGLMGAEPTLDLDPNFGVNVEEVLQCQSIRCYTMSLVEPLFDGFGLAVSNPLTLWAKFSEAAIFILRTHLFCYLEGYWRFLLLRVLEHCAIFHWTDHGCHRLSVTAHLDHFEHAYNRTNNVYGFGSLDVPC